MGEILSCILSICVYYIICNVLYVMKGLCYNVTIALLRSIMWPDGLISGGWKGCY